MASLSLFTGPMAFVTAAASASDIFTLQTPKSNTHTSTTSSSTPQPQSQQLAKPEPTTEVSKASVNMASNISTSTTSSSSATTATTTHLPLTLRSASADLIYRCHSSAVHAWAIAAAAVKPVAWTAHHTARLLLILATVVLAASRLCAVRCGQTVWQACWWHLWACKRATRMRKKLYFEVALAFMGPSGNGLLLVVLWPGWLVLAAAVWGISAAVATVT